MNTYGLPLSVAEKQLLMLALREFRPIGEEEVAAAEALFCKIEELMPGPLREPECSATVSWGRCGLAGDVQ